MILAPLLLALAAAPAFAEGPLSELLSAAGPAYAPAAAPAARPAPVPLPGAYRSERIEGVIVRGYPPFVSATRAALALLKRESRSFEAIRGAVPQIEEYACSGMDVYASTPTFHVGAATWQAGPLWYAGAIAHDARHSQLYRAAKKRWGGLEPRDEEWMKTRGEQLALDYQAGVLRELRAPAKTLAFLESLRHNPVYQDIGRPKAGPEAPHDPLARPRANMSCRGRSW